MQPAQAEKHADARPMMISVRQVDYTCPHEAAALVALLDGYAQDPAGGGEPLHPSVKQGLVDALHARPQAFSVMAWAEGEGADFTRAQFAEPAVWPRPVGLINCFEGFSTFACQPLVNVHDVVVVPEWRGHRIAQRMLQAVEVIARQRGACKLTMEVLSGNPAPCVHTHAKVSLRTRWIRKWDRHSSCKNCFTEPSGRSTRVNTDAPGCGGSLRSGFCTKNAHCSRSRSCTSILVFGVNPL